MTNQQASWSLQDVHLIQWKTPPKAHGGPTAAGMSLIPGDPLTLNGKKCAVLQAAPSIHSISVLLSLVLLQSPCQVN